jgi:protein-arginine kinase activator protein McsA
LKSLEEELKEALDNEDYETAAKLRDKIKNK